MKPTFSFIILCMLILVSCREDDVIVRPQVVPVTQPQYTSVKGFYLLNEGNMGTNKSTLDYMDYTTGEYIRNIYGAANPDVPMELGDVGNDLKTYGSKLWAVINCSNKVEVMRAADAVRIGQVDIPNCRHIKFHRGFAYVTSYAGPVEINPDYSQLGYVAKVDTASLKVVDICIVGYQPDGLEITGDRIYVANSGGYRVPNYEKTLSVIDINSFTVMDTIEIAENLQYVVGDRHGNIWVSSRGDYYALPGRLFCYSPAESRVVKEIDVPVGNLWLDGDSLYIISSQWSNITQSTAVTTAIVDTSTRSQAKGQLITDGTESGMQRPYSIAVNPITKDIYITDAGNFVNPGFLYCYNRDGKMQWRVRTGDTPASIAFIGETTVNRP